MLSHFWLGNIACFSTTLISPTGDYLALSEHLGLLRNKHRTTRIADFLSLERSIGTNDLGEFLPVFTFYNTENMAPKLRRSFIWQRFQRPRTLCPHVFVVTSVLLCGAVNFLTEFDSDRSLMTSGDRTVHRQRLLLSVNESSSDNKGEYPPDVFTLEQKRKGAVILHIIGMCYMFLALSIACDEFFIPALAVITEKLSISEDVAGATFMAAGGSMPELCTSFIGVFVAPKSNVGFGTIVGSAVFNVLFVIGMCAVFSKELLKLTWWPLFRDCMFYSVALIILIVFFTDGKIEWWESLVMIITYFLYVTFMKFNHRIEKFVKSLLKSNKVSTLDSKGTEGNAQDYSLEKAVENLCTSSKQNNGLPCFRYGALQLVIHTIDPLGEASVAVKVNKLKKLKCLKVKVGMERDSDALPTTQDVNRYSSVDDHRQFHLSVLNSSMNVQATCEDRTDTPPAPSFHNHVVNLDNYTAFGDQLRRDSSYHTKSGDITSRNSSLVNGDSIFPLVQIAPDDNHVPGRVPDISEQSNNVYRTSTESQGSQTAGLQLSSHQQLVDIESAKEAALDDESEPIDLSWPSGWKDRIVFIIRAPVVFCMYYTVQDIKRPEKRYLYPWCFIWSMLWIVGFSYLMVWWATEVGDTLGIPTEVMGLTFLAAGTSIPDLITSVLVARKGFGDMAVSSSIGSNLFDVTIGLPVPWLIYSSVHVGNAMVVSSSGLFCSVFLLFIMLIAVVVAIAVSKWRLSKPLGATMFLLYIVFLVISLLLQYNIIDCIKI